MSSNTAIRIAAVGDLLFTTRPGDGRPERGLDALSAEVRELFAACDIVLANLECTLPGDAKVPTEPRLFASESQLQSLVQAGVNVVSLGNNHAFDSYDIGFRRLTDSLNELGIAWCGAGLNLNEAYKPAVIVVKGIRVAIVGVVDASSGMYRFAEADSSGVAPFDTAALCRQIQALRQDADHVIVSPHWGEERYRFPFPAQIEQAHACIDAGASLVLGHHPHVLQGVESYRGAPVAYSLGNFLANRVYWESGDYLTWNRFERTGCILVAELDRNGVLSFEQVPVFDDGTTIRIDRSSRAESYLQRANHFLTRGISPALCRRERFRVRTLLPLLAYLRWAKLRRLRPGHLRKVLRLLREGTQ